MQMKGLSSPLYIGACGGILSGSLILGYRLRETWLELLLTGSGLAGTVPPARTQKEIRSQMGYPESCRRPPEPAEIFRPI